MLQLIPHLFLLSPKNYQLWYHRRALLEFRFKGEVDVLHVAKKELEYVDKILDDDSKNYHVSIVVCNLTFEGKTNKECYTLSSSTHGNFKTSRLSIENTGVVAPAMDH